MSLSKGDEVLSRGSLMASPYRGSNELLAAGAPRPSRDGKILEHADGSPFFWLADTWWLGLTDRIGDHDFNELLAQRKDQGFTAVQVVAGLYPELEARDPRGMLNDSHPWDEGFTARDPGWWDAAEQRIQSIVNAGLVPVIYGAWGYHILTLGRAVLAEHWREIVARWAAYPVMWVVAGEACLPAYATLRTPEAPAISERQAALWQEVAGLVRALDGHRRILTVHPSPGDGSYASSDVFSDRTLFDINALQTGHQGTRAAIDTVRILRRERARGATPVAVAEVCYEGILGSNWHDIQRLVFWLSALSGAAGFGYGADGLWAFAEEPWVGEAGGWGEGTWREAAALAGAAQIGLGRQILEGLRWAKFEPHLDWITPCSTDELPLAPVASGNERQRVHYFPSLAHLHSMDAYKSVTLRQLGERMWRGHFVNPRTGDQSGSFGISPIDGEHVLTAPRLSPLPTMDDWLLVIEAA